MGGGGGKGGASPAAGNQAMGYESWSQGGTPQWDPTHPEAAFAQEGWDYAQSQYDQSQADQAQLAWMMQRPGEIQRNTDYVGGVLGTLNSKNSDFGSIQEALVRHSNFGGADTPYGDNWDQNYSDVFGSDTAGFVWNKDQNYDDPKGLSQGGVRGGWQAIDQAGFDDILASRDLGDYGGLVDASGKSYASGWEDTDAAQLQYVTSLGEATDFVNTNIDAERSNAALMGVDYEITQESKDERVGNALKNFGWDGAAQDKLNALNEEWGAGDFVQTIFGGSGTEAAPEDKPDAAPGGSGGGVTPNSYLTEEDELGGTSLLGA